MHRCPTCGVLHDRVSGKAPFLAKQSNCLACHAAYMRANRKKHRDLAPEAKRRANARSHANLAKRRGQLQAKPCEDCQEPSAEMHHEDYQKPLAVTWLCRKCHLARHKE